MKANENDKKLQDEDDQGEQGGTGTQTGGTEFHYVDVLSTPPRDDVLPPNEIRRLLSEHQDLHKKRVDNQKLTRKERKAIKEGRVILNSTATYRAGLRATGGASLYKTHPIAYKFSGMRDTKVSAFPSDNIAETNLDKKEELQNRLENQLRLRNAPKFNPKPRPY